MKDMIAVLFLALAGLGVTPSRSPAQEPGPAPASPIRAGAPASQLPAQALRLSDALIMAARRNPRLAALQASASASATRVAEASTLPDPVIQLGVMNFGIPDFNADMPTSMAPSVQITQMVPFPGKLSLRGDIAESGRAMAEASAAEAWWEVRSRTSDLFYDLYSLDRRIEVMTETLALLRNFQTVAKAMYSAGTGRQSDVLRADVEVARMDGEIRKMVAMRIATAARFNALLDLPAATPVASPVLDPMPLSLPPADTLSAWAEQSRPALARGRLQVDRARSREGLAHREIWPNLTFALQYGQRDRGLGTERMGSAMIGFSLPVHAGARQLAARDEAAALKRMAEAELGTLRASVDARLGELMAQLDQARTLIDLYRSEVLPEAEVSVEAAFSSYRVGSVDFMTLVDAQMTVNRYQGELYALLADYGRAVSALESAIGRTLPPSTRTLTEDR